MTRTISILERTLDLRSACRRARERPYSDILSSLDRWAGAWEDPAFPGWEGLRELGGGPLVESALRTLCRSARRECLEWLIEDQLGSAEIFTRFVSRPGGGRKMARGYGLIGAFLGGGASLSGWQTFLYALLARSSAFARASEADAGWSSLFIHSLGLIDPDLAACVNVMHWPSDDTASHTALCKSSDVVVAFGANETMNRIRSLVPGSTPFIPYGSRLSLGIVCKDASCDDAAAAASADVAIYDQAGCLSPQVVLVEGDAQRGRAFAAALDRSLASQAASPPRSRDSAQQAAIRTARELAAFEEGTLILGPPDLGWTVIYSPDSSIGLSPLGRTVLVRSFEGSGELSPLLSSYDGMLQAAGLAAGSVSELEEIAHVLAEAGVTRICPLGQMQLPRLCSHHDGRALLSSLVQIIDFDG